MKQHKLPHKIFFSGIGGIGMSGLALILKKRGYDVFGSDAVSGNMTEKLLKMDIPVIIGQKKGNIDTAELLVISAAIKDDNPEIIEAKEKGIEIITRSELLGILMSEKKGIAIAGTHGKTTTSSMLSLVLEGAKMDPTVVIGGEVKNIGGNAKDGKGEYLVAEACEYERAFLDLHPFAAIITNIEEDHLDTYGDLEHILESFMQFVSQIENDGFLVISAWDSHLSEVTKNYQGKVITYGFHEGDFQAKNIKVKELHTYFDVEKYGKVIGELKIAIPGAHNILNALAVTATSLEVGVKFETIEKSLTKFMGAKRRFEIKGNKNGILVIDDYAHHPTEIQATLDGLESYYPGKKVWCVFQAHQYSRTKFLLLDFAKSFKKTDHVIIPEIYEARDSEEDKKAVSGEILAAEINKISNNAEYIKDFHSITEFLRQKAKSGDVIITIGAGPIYKVGEEFLK